MPPCCPRPPIPPASTRPTCPRPRATPSSASAPPTSTAPRHSAYAQYSYQDWTGQNQGVGGQTLAAAGYNNQYHEDDVVVHADSTLSPSLINQFSVVGEHDFSRNLNATEAPHVNVVGDFSGGSAQNDALSTEYNFRIYDMMSWIHGKHYIKFGVGTPHIDRRAFDDNTNSLGSFTYAPTLAADGVTVLQSALQNYTANLPSGYSINYGVTHFIYHQQEMGAFAQDQYKINPRLSITPGLRYDWQNFLATRTAVVLAPLLLRLGPRSRVQAGAARRRRRLLRSLRLRPAA